MRFFVKACLAILGCLGIYFLTPFSGKMIPLEGTKIYNLRGYKIPCFSPRDPHYSNHWGERKTQDIKHLVLHITTVNLQETLKIFTGKVNNLEKDFWTSAHYVIKENGEIIQVVPEEKRARHAGTGDLSDWRGQKDLNETSLGFELVNTTTFDEMKSAFQQKITWIPLGQDQINTLGKLCQFIVKKYKIPPYNILGHSDVAYARTNGQGKIDPGPLFPWEYLYTHYQLGMWLTKKEFNTAKKITKDQFNMALFLKYLQIIGYKTPMNAEEVQRLIYVFQCHFSHNQKPEKCTGIPTAHDMVWAYGLATKYKD